MQLFGRAAPRRRVVFIFWGEPEQENRLYKRSVDVAQKTRLASAQEALHAGLIRLDSRLCRPNNSARHHDVVAYRSLSHVFQL